MTIAVAAPAIDVRARDGGTFTVTNGDPAPVRLHADVAVEGFDGRTWRPFLTELHLVTSCGREGVLRNPAWVWLDAGKTLIPPP